MKKIKVDKVILYYMDRVDPDGNLYRFYVYKGMASEIDMLFDIGSDFESVIRMLYSFRNGPKSGIKVADPEDNYEWTNKDGNEKYSTKNLPKAHFRWDWRRYTLSKESVDKITEFVDTILES